MITFQFTLCLKLLVLAYLKTILKILSFKFNPDFPLSFNCLIIKVTQNYT